MKYYQLSIGNPISKIRAILISCAIGSLCFLTNSAWAQTIHDSLFHILPGFEIKTTAQPHAIEAGSLDYLTIQKKDLIAYQGNTLMHTLERYPGISSIQTGTGIAKPVIRSMSFNRVIVNEYDIKQEGQQWGVDHGLEIDPFNVDKIEIIKGPVSVIYGSDGLGGVINILPPEIPHKDTIQGSVTMLYKSNNNLWGTSAHLLHNKNDIYTLARVTYQDYASYKVPATSFTYNSYILPIYNHRLKNTSGKDLGISFMQGIRRKWGHTHLYFSLYNQQAGFFPGAFGIPRVYQLNEDGSSRNISLPKQQIRHLKIISNTHFHIGKWMMDAALGWQHNRRQELSLPHAHGNGAAPQGDLSLQLDLQTFTMNLKAETFLTQKLKIVSGLSTQIQENKRAGYEFLIPDFSQWQAGMYHYISLDLAPWILTAGLRGDFSVQNAQAGYITLYDAQGLPIGREQRSPEIHRQYWNAAASVGARTNLLYNLELKINAGSAYRIPSLTELTSNGVHHGSFRHELGDSSLRAERGYMFDVGLFWKQKQWNVSITPFLSYYDRYIYLRPSGLFSPLPEAGQIYHYTHGNTIFTGGEASISVQPNKVWKLYTAAEYVWNKNISRNLPLPFTPPFSLLQEISWNPGLNHTKWQSLQLRISGHYFAAQNRTDVNEPPTEGYLLLHAGIDYTLPVGRKELQLHLLIRNLADVRYYNNMSRYRILNLPEQGRNMQCMIQYVF